MEDAPEVLVSFFFFSPLMTVLLVGWFGDLLFYQENQKFKTIR